MHRHSPNERPVLPNAPDGVKGTLDGEHLHECGNRQRNHSDHRHLIATMCKLAQVLADQNACLIRQQCRQKKFLKRQTKSTGKRKLRDQGKRHCNHGNQREQSREGKCCRALRELLPMEPLGSSVDQLEGIKKPHIILQLY